MSTKQTTERLKIANAYGNFDMVHDELPKGYVYIKGQRLQPLARRLGIKFAPAVVEWVREYGSRYPAKPRIGGIVISAAAAKKYQSEFEALAARQAQLRAEREHAAQTRLIEEERRLDDSATRIGYRRGSKTEASYLAGHLRPEQAEFLAWQAHYRHAFTNYDSLLSGLNDEVDGDESDFGDGYDLSYDDRRYLSQANRDHARRTRVDEAIPDNWPEYLAKYEFNSPEAEAMSSVLKDPKKCHPVWFKRREIGLRGKPLVGLTYEIIRDSAVTLPGD